MGSKYNPEPTPGPNDPFFGDDFFVVPPEEEIRERARQTREDNQDGYRHLLDVSLWETFPLPEVRRCLIPRLVWSSRDIEARWVAEGYSMDLRDVCAIAEEYAPWTFPCLVCGGTEIRIKDRHHLWLVNDSLGAVCDKATLDEDHLRHLICPSCAKRRDQEKEDQRRLDEEREQAMLKAYRNGDYSERRKSKEYSILKRVVHRRDRYRCRLCGRDDLPLHLHHSSYLNYAKEKLEDVISLCELCHKRHHQTMP